MGPLLFLIYYMNDLTSVSDTIFPIMFADDIDVFIQETDFNAYKLQLL